MTESEKRTDPIQGKIIHEYDGIEEADNDLPRWWLLTLYGAILFAAGYWFYFHVYRVGPLPREEYAAEVAASAESGGEVTDAVLDALASSAAEVERGRALFGEHCAVCHGDQAQGNIGPNLTDDAWIHGGAPIDIHTTIKNGVGAKGMPAWGATLGPASVRSLAVFVTSVRNTNVPGGKEAQGEPWAPGTTTAAAPAEAAPSAEGAPPAEAPSAGEIAPAAGAAPSPAAPGGEAAPPAGPAAEAPSGAGGDAAHAAEAAPAEWPTLTATATQTR